MTNINSYSLQTTVIWDSPQGEGASQVALVVKNLSANAGDTSSVPGWGRSPGGGHGAGVGDGHGSPASCRPRGPKESDTTEPLN